MVMEPKFWNGIRWSGDAAFGTVQRFHVSCSPADGRPDCDLTVVGCADGRWYVEDYWGADATGHEGVWNPFDPGCLGPRFFPSEGEARRHAVAVVSTVCGVSPERVETLPLR